MNIAEIITRATENALELEEVENLLQSNGYEAIKYIEYTEKGFASGYTLEVMEEGARYSFFFDWQTIILCVDVWSFVDRFYRHAPYILSKPLDNPDTL